MIFLSFLFQFGGDQVVPVCVDVLDIAKTRDKLKDVGPVDLLVNRSIMQGSVLCRASLRSPLKITTSGWEIEK